MSVITAQLSYSNTAAYAVNMFMKYIDVVISQNLMSSHNAKYICTYNVISANVSFLNNIK